MERKTSLKKSPLKKKRPLVGSSSGLRKKKPVQGRTGASRRVSKPKKKVWKFKKTELAECDAEVSREIRERDLVCQYPGCGTDRNLTNSHYIGRKNWNTRFLLRNCLLICSHHHFFNRNVGYEFQKARKEKEGWDGQYTIHMKQLLGEEGFYDLIKESEGNKTRKEAILETQKRYNLRQPIESGDNANQDPTPEV